MFSFFKKDIKSDEDKEKSQQFDTYGGFLGDRSKETVQMFINSIVTLLMIGLFLVGVMLVIKGKFDYNREIQFNTTEIGTELKFEKSGTVVTLSDVWVDKNRESAIIKLGYDEASRNSLSVNGNNYKLYNVTEGHTEDIEVMEYGILGTRGDGYLFIKGDLGKSAYQIVIESTLNIDTEVNTEISMTNKDVESSISSFSYDDMDENGTIENDESNLDIINFRFNPYSSNTKVFDGSFLNKDGQFDYSKVVEMTSIKGIIKSIDNDIKEIETAIEKLKVSREEFESRIKRNPDDESSVRNLENVERSIKENEKKKEDLIEKRRMFEQSDFNKESFGNIQDEFKSFNKS